MLKKHKIEVIYAVVVLDDNCYTSKGAHKEVSMNNRIANEINEQRIFQKFLCNYLCLTFFRILKDDCKKIDNHIYFKYYE